MAEIDLVDAVTALRRELIHAMASAEDEAVQFPVDQVMLQFQVGLTKTGEGRAGIRFWVFELGSSVQYARETVQTVTVVLGTPVDADGRPIKILSESAMKPG